MHWERPRAGSIHKKQRNADGNHMRWPVKIQLTCKEGGDVYGGGGVEVTILRCSLSIHVTKLEFPRIIFELQKPTSQHSLCGCTLLTWSIITLVLTHLRWPVLAWADITKGSYAETCSSLEIQWGDGSRVQIHSQLNSILKLQFGLILNCSKRSYWELRHIEMVCGKLTSSPGVLCIHPFFPFKALVPAIPGSEEALVDWFHFACFLLWFFFLIWFLPQTISNAGKRHPEPESSSFLTIYQTSPSHSCEGGTTVQNWAVIWRGNIRQCRIQHEDAN